MNKSCWFLAGVLGAALAAPALAQGVSDATGVVTDKDKNPIVGATVTFSAQSNPKVVYSGTTNKKGRYSIGGLFSAVENDRWDLKVEAPGWDPLEVHVESRNANQVLIGDMMTAKISRTMAAPDIVIRPLGHATVDWTMVPAGSVQQAAAPTAEAAAAAAAAAAEAAAKIEDPWDAALTLANAGKLDEALPAFDKALEAQPDDAERHEALAKVLFRLEKRSRAEAEAQKATSLDPNRTEAWMLLFSLYEQRNDLTQAQAALDAARKVAPQDLRILDRQAYLATRKGDRDGAIAAYTEMTKINPQNAEAWAALGNLQAEAGHAQASEQAYAKVVELDPKKAYQTYYNLGLLIANRESATPDDTRRAADAFRKAVEIKPDYAPAWQQLGYTLVASGDNKGAAEALQTYLKTRPDAPDAERVRSMIKALGK